MESNKPKTPKKGAGKRLREFSEKNRGKPSPALLEILKTPPEEKSSDKKSAKPSREKEAET